MRAGLLVAVLVFLGPLAPALAVHAQNTLPLETVTPSAPEPIKQLSARILSLLLFIALVAGLAAIAFAGFRFVTGGEDAGKWFVRGLVALFVAVGFWAIINYFLA